MADIWEIEDGLLIEEGVLKECTDKCARSVTIPDGVTEIGEKVFLRDWKLTSVQISASVTKIGGSAFYGCEALESVKFGGTVAQWEAVKGKAELLKNIPATIVKCADGEWQTPSVLVEYGVFAKCFDKSVTSMVIGEDITEIGNYAFGDCTSLTSVVIPNSVKKIDYNAFEHCTSLSSLEIPYGVTEIGEYAFAVCSSLESVKIPSSVKRIEREAFFDCKRLSKVVLGDDFDNVTAEWFDSLEKANPNYEIVCTKDSSTYKAIELSQKLKTHNKEIALQIAKDQKMAEVQKTGAEALIKSLLESIEESSFEIISNSKSDLSVFTSRNSSSFSYSDGKSIPKIASRMTTVFFPLNVRDLYKLLSWATNVPSG